MQISYSLYRGIRYYVDKIDFMRRPQTLCGRLMQIYTGLCEEPIPCVEFKNLMQTTTCLYKQTNSYAEKEESMQRTKCLCRRLKDYAIKTLCIDMKVVWRHDALCGEHDGYINRLILMQMINVLCKKELMQLVICLCDHTRDYAKKQKLVQRSKAQYGDMKPDSKTQILIQC